MLRPVFAFVATILLLAGCTDRTSLLVVVDSSTLHVPGDLDTLHFQATSASGRMASGDYRITSPLPQSIALRPAVDENGESVTVVVTASLGSAVVGRATGTGMLVAGETTTVHVELTRCTTDCGSLDGGVPTDAALDFGGPPDLGLVDAARPDGGTMDGGPTDAGPPDLGAPDLGGPGSCATGGCATHLVISELATGSATTGTDEFVEIYNPTSAPIDASGLLVEYKSAAGATWATRATLPAGTTIPAYAYYLVVSMGYAGAVAGDSSATAAWSSGFASSGGHVHLAFGTTEVDRIGWGTAAMPEGAAAPGFSSDSARSYERRAFSTSDVTSMTTGADATYGNSLDTDDNATDFVVRPTRDPQNHASPPETP